MEEESDLSTQSIDYEKSEGEEDLKKRLEETKNELDDLLDSYWNYAKRMLKFSLGSWIFSVSLFISILLLLSGPSLALNPPPISISLLIGGGLAGVITISTVFLTKKRRRIQKLKEKREKFESAYRRKLLESEWEKAKEREDFLHSLLRHDVKNKLQVIRGYVRMLEDYDLSEEAENYLSLLMKGAEEGMEIIEKVRTLREAQEEEIREVGIAPAIYDAVDEVEDMGEEKDMEIDVDCPEKGCNGMGGSLLDRIFFNIIENAVQHSDGSMVRIRGRTDEDEVKCILEDDGKGISDEKKDKIFDKGYTTDEERGTGLGMFLVRTLLDIYGGDVEVKDSELGGARFDVHLKKA